MNVTLLGALRQPDTYQRRSDFYRAWEVSLRATRNVAESLQVATWIADVVDSLAEKGAEGDPAVIARVKSEVVALCNRYPVYSK